MPERELKQGNRMNGKKIRTYTLNYWLKSFTKKEIWMVLFTTYLMMALYYIDHLLGEGKAMSFFSGHSCVK